MMLLLVLGGAVSAQVPATVIVPETLPEAIKKVLDEKRLPIEEKRIELRDRSVGHNKRCNPSPADQEGKNACKVARDQFNADVAAFVLIVKAFNADVKAAEIDALRQRVQQLERQLEMDKDAIRMLGFKNRETEFQDWVKLSNDAKIEFEKQVFDEIANAAQDKMLGSFEGFDQTAADGLISKLGSVGLVDPKFNDVLLNIARHPDRPAAAADAAMIVDGLQKLSESAQSSLDGQKLAALATVLEFFVHDPQLKLLLSDLKLTTAAVYNNAARRVSMAQIRQLTALTESELKSLKSLQCVIESHVGEKYSVEKKLAGLEGREFTRAEPSISAECRK